MKRNTFIIQQLKASAAVTFLTQPRRGGGRVKQQARQELTLLLGCCMARAEHKASFASM